ncbi:MAG: D-alanyl-D-alanine carboxypeptidase [Clostridia bacterium]|nr:D-alanyl-D-alanine carboxypeptidase [Clostridia bacterium]
MKKTRLFGLFLVGVLLLVFVMSPLSVSAYTPDAETLKGNLAKASIIVFLEGTATAEQGVNGRDSIMYENNGDMKLSPGAMMRVMVGLYAKKLIKEKNIDMEKTTGTYTLPLEETYILGTGLTLANMEEGETWTVKDMLSLSMIQTSADACVTLAATLAGSVDAFVMGMNSYAKEIGCTNTTFGNVTGLDHPNQKTTVRDMYIMLRYAIDDPELHNMLGATEVTVKPVSKHPQRSWENSNYMLRGISDYYYEAMELGKTGVSDDSGKALASVCHSENYRYLTVVMGCPMENEYGEGGTHYDSTRVLCNWAFNTFEYETMLTENQPMVRQKVDLSWKTDTVTLVAENPLSCLVPLGVDPNTVRKEVVLNHERVDAPVKKGQVLGKAVLYIQEDVKIGEVNLVASESVKRSTLLYIWSRIEAVLSSPWLWVALGALVVLIIAYAILAFLHNQEKRRNARNHRRKRKYKPLK